MVKAIILLGNVIAFTTGCYMYAFFSCQQDVLLQCFKHALDDYFCRNLTVCCFRNHQ